MSEEIPPINLEIFNELSEILEDELDELINDFFNATPTQLEFLLKAIEDRDFKKIFAISHSQAGVSGNLGLDKLSKTYENMVTQAKEENIESCQQLSKLLLDYFDECKILLTDKLKNK